MGELNHGVTTPLFWVRSSGVLCAGLHVWIFHESHSLARYIARAHFRVSSASAYELKVTQPQSHAGTVRVARIHARCGIAAFLLINARVRDAFMP